MSFTPLPKIFTETCSHRDIPFPQILELGCGDGCFRSVLAQAGCPSWGLDLTGPKLGTVAEVVGDALSPPIAVGSLDILLAANLLRHLVPVDRSLRFLARWMDLLKPGGSLFIFEDEPGDTPASVANYRDLMVFLQRLLPENRGPMLPLNDFQPLVKSLGLTARWEFGQARNRYPINAAAVLEFLGVAEQVDRPLGRLIEGIGRDGLDPGNYWWARAQADAEGTGS